jgi:hypothetical protein
MEFIVDGGKPNWRRPDRALDTDPILAHQLIADAC